MQRGYVKLWRKLADSGVLQDAEATRLLMWIFVKASWKGSTYFAKGQLMQLGPGQVVIGRKKLARELETDESTIRRALDSLKKRLIISLETTQQWTRITVVNWDKYQNGVSEVTQEQPTFSPRSTTVKEGIEEKKGKKKEDTLSADAESGAAKAPKPIEPHIEMRNYWHAEFEKRFKRKAAFIPAKWLADAEKSLLDQIGMIEAKNRTHNCLEDGYKTSPRYIDFLKNNEDFATLRRFVVKGDPNEYKSKRGTFDPGAAKGMLSSLASNFTTPKPQAPKQFNIPVAHTCRFIVKEDIIEGRQAYACTGCYRREFEDSLNVADRETLGLPLH